MLALLVLLRIPPTVFDLVDIRDALVFQRLLAVHQLAPAAWSQDCMRAKTKAISKEESEEAPIQTYMCTEVLVARMVCDEHGNWDLRPRSFSLE